MANSLPLDLLVDITSTGVKDAFTIGKLNTILITKYNKGLPNGKFVELADLNSALNNFGSDSDVYKFASAYFGFVSKSATKCDLLYVYNWSKEATSAVLKGGMAPALSTLQSLNGKAKVTIGADSDDIEVNFAGISNYADAANKIQEAIRTAPNATGKDGFTDAEVTYSNITQGFIIKGGVAGQGETIGFLSRADDGEDIHDKLGLTLGELATTLEGEPAVADLAKVLSEIETYNGNYYIITPNFQFDNVETDLATLGSFVNSSNDRFLAVYSWDNPLLEVSGSKATEAYAGYNGLFIDNKKADYQNAMVCALFSAMDLTKPAGNYNIAFNDATTYQTNAITEKAKYLAMQENKANAPCKFGILGSEDTVYMDGTIMGSKTNSANVYMANSFLKFNQQIAIYNMFKAQKLIGLRDKNSLAIISAYLDEVFVNAVSANIIATGVELTTTEQQTIMGNFGSLVSNVSDVITKIQTSGYFYAISNVNTVTKELSITEAYTANTPVKKIVINSYILGA